MPKKKITPAPTYQVVGLKNIYEVIRRSVIESWEYDSDLPDGGLKPSQIDGLNSLIYQAYDMATDDGKEAIDNFCEALTDYTFKELRNQAH